MLFLNPQQIPDAPSDDFDWSGHEGEEAWISKHICEFGGDGHDPR